MTTTFDRVLACGGDAGRRIASLEWSAHSLGPPDHWPQSLKTALSICLASRTPILVGWGPELFQFYNDAYRSVLGETKHERAMGARAAEIWAEIWHIMRPIFESILAGGPAVGHEDMVMFLDRHGFSEETFFNHAHCPILGDDGAVAGVFTTVTETTRRVVGDRRLKTLKTLAERIAPARSTREVAVLAADVLHQDAADVPYCLIYNRNGERLERAAVSGFQLEQNLAVAPATFDSSAPPGSGAPWPFSRVLTTREPTLVNVDVVIEMDPRSVAEHRPAPSQALMLAASLSADDPVDAVLIVGLSPHLALDERYRDFLGLAAGQLAASISSARAYEEQQQRLRSLEELDRAKTAFFSNVSHEFRTPLTLMLGPIEDALASQAEALSGESLHTVHRNALRLLRLVNMLLDFARIEAGRLQASYAPTDLAKLTVDFASGFESAFERAGLALEIDCPPLPQPVYVDRDMWEKIVLNLLSNALKFTFEGSVRVSLRAAGGSAELTVRDTGIGISEAELPLLFQRFHRVQNARARSHEGMGIGLALSHDLARLQGGELRATSVIGEGSAFIVSLPFGHAHLPADRISLPPPEDAPATREFATEALHWQNFVAASARVTPVPLVSGEGRHARVLIADDNPDMRDYLARILDGRYTLTVTDDGEQALEAARTEGPDLVLSDVMMPGLDGFGLLRELRADASTRAIPVILLSARAGEESRIEGLEAGADDYLIKPFSARELLARVATHIALGRARAEALRARFEAEAANRMKDDFLAMLAHELRNPLAPIATALMLMRERSDGTPSRERVIIERQVGHLTGLVDDLLDVSRITRGKVELRRERVKIADSVREAIDTANPVLQERAHTLFVEVAAHGLDVYGDPTRITQVLTNLLTNAAKYTDRGGQISIKAERSGEHVVIRVRDNGIGIEPNMLAHVFDPFAQDGPAVDRSRGGLGLGLTIVRNLVAMHGGMVDVTSEGKDRGSEFVVRLPAADAPSEPVITGGPRAAAPDPDATPEANVLAGRKILVVEDNVDAAELLAEWFRGKGADVRTALDGDSALRSANEHRPELGVIDIGLPGIDGYELARRLRQDPVHERLLLVAVTGYGQDSDRERSAESGFDAHLVKPLDLSHFEPLLREWL